MWSWLWKAAKFAAVWELSWWSRRDAQRTRVMLDAALQAKKLGRPLLVVGAPDHGMTGGYPCGDITADNEPTSSCPNFLSIDLSKGRLPLADNSVVVFIACTLEYVPDLVPAMRELFRVSGGEIYLVRVQPWTLTAYFYPGAQRILPWPSGKLPTGSQGQPENPLTVQGGIDATRSEIESVAAQIQAQAAAASGPADSTGQVAVSGFASAHRKRMNEFSRFIYQGK